MVYTIHTTSASDFDTYFHIEAFIIWNRGGENYSTTNLHHHCLLRASHLHAAMPYSYRNTNRLIGTMSTCLSLLLDLFSTLWYCINPLPHALHHTLSNTLYASICGIRSAAASESSVGSHILTYIGVHHWGRQSREPGRHWLRFIGWTGVVPPSIHQQLLGHWQHSVENG